jgi:hypothetical protein
MRDIVDIVHELHETLQGPGMKLLVDTSGFGEWVMYRDEAPVDLVERGI